MTETTTKHNYTEADFQDYEHTGPDTLCGRYLRTFWHPIYLSDELKPGWAIPVTLMSEQFTLFRGETGTAHLIAMRCAHRGTQLSTGWVEDDCVRCRYHGWKFDGTGQCVEAPLEEPNFHQRIKIKSYPVEEYLGAIFAYIGEGDAPPLPRYPRMEQEGFLDWQNAPRACNYVNELENDPGHGSFTHRKTSLPDRTFDLPLELHVEENPFGITWRYIYPDGELIRLRGMPTLRHEIIAPSTPDGRWRFIMRWKTPIDDLSHTSFTVELFPVTGEEAERLKARREAWFAKGGHQVDPELTNEILAGRLRLHDVERERTDVNLTHLQDDVTQIGQGAIRDRTQEHLGRSDGHVVLLRKLFEREMRAFAEGRPLTQWYLPDDLGLTAEGRQALATAGQMYERV
jgi:5,5'-dehydrodivanillate O-demethylase oxygenase subunit